MKFAHQRVRFDSVIRASIPPNLTECNLHRSLVAPGEAAIEERAAFAVGERRGRLADSFEIPRPLRLAAVRGLDVKERADGFHRSARVDYFMQWIARYGFDVR